MPDPALEAADQFFAADFAGRRVRSGRSIWSRSGWASLHSFSAWSDTASRTGRTTSRWKRLGPKIAIARAARPTAPIVT